MPEPRFIQIHTLQSYPGALLNRDDAGLAKRLPYGGATRTRVSSQCLKRHWRIADDEFSLASLGVPMGTRSRHIIDRAILGRLINDGVGQEIAEAIAEVFLKQVFQESAARKRAKAERAAEEAAEEFTAETKQAVLFGQPEIDYLHREAARIAAEADGAKSAAAAAEAFFKDRDVRVNLAAMKHHAGLESALFGRMVTSDLLANTDAAVHVAHAFTVHAEESESDYFTVVDDLKRRSEGDDSGSAGIFDMELTSGLYYGYVVVDVPLLVSNLEGIGRAEWLSAGTDRSLAGRIVEHLCHLIAKVSPGAKLGSTAPYGWAPLMLVEAGNRQPRSLAGAFRKPVAFNGDLLADTVTALSDHLTKLDAAYGRREVRAAMSVEATALPGSMTKSCDELAAWAAAAVREGTVSSVGAA